MFDFIYLKHYIFESIKAKTIEPDNKSVLLNHY